MFCSECVKLPPLCSIFSRFPRRSGILIFYLFHVQYCIVPDWVVIVSNVGKFRWLIYETRDSVEATSLKLDRKIWLKFCYSSEITYRFLSYFSAWSLLDRINVPWRPTCGHVVKVNYKKFIYRNIPSMYRIIQLCKINIGLENIVILFQRIRGWVLGSN